MAVKFSFRCQNFYSLVCCATDQEWPVAWNQPVSSYMLICTGPSVRPRCYGVLCLPGDPVVSAHLRESVSVSRANDHGLPGVRLRPKPHEHQVRLPTCPRDTDHRVRQMSAYISVIDCIRLYNVISASRVSALEAASRQVPIGTSSDPMRIHSVVSPHARPGILCSGLAQTTRFPTSPHHHRSR